MMHIMMSMAWVVVGQAALECDTRPNALTVNPFGYRWAYEGSSNPLKLEFHTAGPLASYTGNDKTKYFNEVTRAMNVWFAMDCDAGTGGLQRPRIAATSDTTTLVVSATASASDRKNVVYWSDSNNDFTSADNQVLGYTVVTSASTTQLTSHRIADADMLFNKRHFQWRIQSTVESVTGQCAENVSNCADTFTVALHEFGHFFGLDHVGCQESVMYPAVWVGGAGLFTETSLKNSEKTGMCALYPLPPSNISATEKAPGDACESNTQCYQTSSGSHTCEGGAGVGSKSGMCVEKCTAHSDCDPFYTCSALGTCIPGVVSRDGGRVVPCPAGQWECTDRTCISNTKRCDSVSDCSDASDEWQCGCGTDAVRCPGFSRDSSKCINLSLLCNGANDCGGDIASDEDQAYCESSSAYCTAHPSSWQCPTRCLSGEIRCPLSGECVSRSKICDKNLDCHTSKQTDALSDPDSPDEYACSGHVQNDGASCESCTEDSQCDGLKCVKASATSTSGLCVRACENNVCPFGFTCMDTDSVGKVCYPVNPSSCISRNKKADLGEVCYDNKNTPADASDDEFHACKTGSNCFVFTRKGVCMPSCTSQKNALGVCPAGQSCCSQGQTCCFGVTPFGNCISTPSTSVKTGACFDNRVHGSSCFAPIQAVCGGDQVCLGPDAQESCYGRCEKTTCGEGEECVSLTLNPPIENQKTLSICCDSNTLNGADLSTCHARLRAPAYDVGVKCVSSAECLSGVCYGNVCTRECDAAWALSCPDETMDVNHDGKPDGGMVCKRQLNSKYYCMPKPGTSAAEPPPYGPTPQDKKGCACNHSEGVWVWLLLGGVVWLRMRAKPAC
jgi:hypothetical protein